MSDVQITVSNEGDAQVISASLQETQITSSVPGIQGPVGQGFPSGGTTNQVLFKQSNTSYDAVWGFVTSSMIGDLEIVNTDVAANAAIAGTKISPNFGSQNVITTGTNTAASFIPTSSTVPTNGVYLHSANSVAISTNGTGRLFIDASGNVGIDTVLTGTKGRLRVAKTGGGDIAAFSDDATNSIILSVAANNGVGITNDGNGYLTLGTNNTERLRITSAGLVGVGTSSPSYLLDVAGPARIKTGATGTPFIVSTGGDSQGTIRFGSTSFEYSINGGADYLGLLFNAGGSERLRITSAGLVGVGTSSPSRNLDIAAGQANVGITSNTTSAGNEPTLVFTHAGNNSYVIKGGNNLQFASDAGTNVRMTLTTAGLLGIGTTSPTSLLHLSTSGLADLRFTDTGEATDQKNWSWQTGTGIGAGTFRLRAINDANSTGENAYIVTRSGVSVQTHQWLTAGSERLRITSAGLVGIGTNSVTGTNTRLEVSNDSAEIKVSSTYAYNENFRGIRFGVTGDSTDYSGVRFKVNSGELRTEAGFSGWGGFQTFYTNGSERLRITSAGLVGIGTSSPSQALSVTGSIAATTPNGTICQLTLEQTSQNAFSLQIPASTQRFAIKDLLANVERFVINSVGSVGIGTTSPSSNLDVFGSTTSVVRIQGGSGGSDTNRRATLELLASGSKLYKLTASAADGSLQILDDDFGERARIDSSGRVGIGVSSPQQSIDTSGNIRLSSGGSRVLDVLQSVNAAAYTGPGFYSQTSIGYGVASGGTHRWIGGGDGNTELMRLTSTGLGIGTTSPSAIVHANSGSASDVYFRSSNSLATSSLGTAADGSTYVYNSAAYPVTFSTNATERARIDSSGRLLVGTSSSSANTRLVVQGNTAGGTYQAAVVDCRINGANPPANYTIGEINFRDSADARGALIKGESDGDWATNDYPGRLVFSTTADGASSPTERLRITSAGLVGVGTSSPDSTLHIATTASSTVPGFRLSSSGSLANNDIFRVQINGLTNGFRMFQDASSNVRYTFEGGSVGIGTTDPGYLLDCQKAGTQFIRSRTNDTGAGNNAGGFVGEYLGGGGGTNTQVALAAGNSYAYLSTLTNAPLLLGVNSVEKARIDTSGRLLVGTSTSPSAGALTQYANFVARGNTGGPGFAGIITVGRGEAATSITSGAEIGYLTFSDLTGNEFATIQCAADANAGTNDYPGRLVFSTTKDGGSSPLARFRISNTGAMGTSSSGDGIVYSVTAGAGTSTFFIAGNHSGTEGTEGSGTTSFYVWSNGNVQNTNNSYTAISDIKLKENVVNANSQWDDIKSLQVRNYNLKEGQTHRQIGLIAQEVEPISPGLVYESPDRDAEGNDLGTVTKSVNYSVLYMKAVKALQEAMERIETLEAKVAALESA